MSNALGRMLRETGAALKAAGGMEIFARHRNIVLFRSAKPFFTNDTFIAPTASVIGDVTNWDESSVWYNAVVRADSSHPITIGFCSNVQEGAVVTTVSEHVSALDTGLAPLTHIGHYVSIGAGSVLISCRIGDMVEVGDKCTILEGALVESYAKLEAGSLVPPNARIPSGELWGGNPASFIRELNGDEKGEIEAKAAEIHKLAKEHQEELLPYGYTYVHLEELEQKNAPATQG
eukprot:CAMPEP_0118702502 /NCGR_PEP_ID=MMETSP0800-20121206/17930_1 /TAXON_ID=210618 ORGANISM="Striatella unipunctata, Strain CCMP2910" /NCGR_SAMPLE_ID=MMETSP0800 /ASSEMBLY_ACC=CAM_ASM_000638 /LENGTH=232 /DNA_ID=CAMNT_0006603717 /DNA_START=78 /DNA_END=776 /DNA_ORIENTATION=-